MNLSLISGKKCSPVSPVIKSLYNHSLWGPFLGESNQIVLVGLPLLYWLSLLRFHNAIMKCL